MEQAWVGGDLQRWGHHVAATFPGPAQGSGKLLLATAAVRAHGSGNEGQVRLRQATMAVKAELRQPHS